MHSIGKSTEIITENAIWAFKKTLSKTEGSSIFSAFLESDVYEENGEKGRDFKLTGDEINEFFIAIGADMKEKFNNWYKQRVVVENIYNSIASLNLEKEYTQYNKKKYDKAIKSIDAENIEELLFNCDYSGKIIIEQLQTSFFKNNETEEYSTTRTKEERQTDCKHIRKIMQKWCKEKGIDTSELDKKEFKLDILNDYYTLMHNYREVIKVKAIMQNDVSDKMQQAINAKYEQATKDGIELTTNNPALSKEQKQKREINDKIKNLRDIAKDVYGENSDNVKRLEERIKQNETMLNDSGNGMFDKSAMQLTGNCWLLAGINALVHTDFGKQFLEKNIVKDNEKHIFAVHLQEAENNNLPKPKGDGIYVFSEKEVLEAQNGDGGLASGEGDITAFALAIESYLKESGKKLKEDQENYQDGNINYMLFELVTGLNAPKTYLGVHNEIGIQHEIAQEIDEPELIDGEGVRIRTSTRLNYFDKIYDMSEKKNAAIVLSYANHAFSVVGVNENYLLIQESNLSDGYKDKFELIENSFPPTYKVDKDVFEKTFIAYSALKWE